MTSPAIAAELPRGVSSKPVRVAHLLHTVAHGGVETALLNWFSKFDGKIDARMYCFTNPGATEKPFLDAAREQGLDVGTLPWNRWKPVWRAARLMAEEIRRNRIDILHCHNTYANMVGILAAKLTPVRTVTTFYVWGDFTRVRNALQWIDERLMGRFDQVTAHCRQCFDDTVSRGFPANRLRLAICGYEAKSAALSLSERLALRAQLGLNESHRAIIYGARFWPEKAHTNLLDAMALLRKRHSEAILLLPGTGPEFEKTKAYSTALGLDDCVRFLGFRSDYEQLLAASDYMVHPSDNEGVALAVCAAMAAGLPIVASRVGGLAEVLEHDRSALLIPPRNPEALANSLSDLFADPLRAAALGREAKRFIEEEYSLDVATRRLTDIYTSMMRRPKAGLAS